MTNGQSVTIPVEGRKVSALLEAPPNARICYVLAHGAGAGMLHPFMAAIANGLAERNVATLRYQFPYMEQGLGIPTGAASGLVVFEIDSRNGGNESYELQVQSPSAFLELLEVRTGSGNAHLYFRDPDRPLLSRAGVRPGINFYAEGGYVVAPPSLHKTGRRYRFAHHNGYVAPPLPQVG
jgi:bifunctional DNA primase/polymerase-like protein/alpha/beta hydrolase family protein